MLCAIYDINKVEAASIAGSNISPILKSILLIFLSSLLLYIIEVDIQEFDPEDLDICVEGDFLILKGEREVKRGNNVSKRVFNQRSNLPSGVDVDKISSQYKLNGKLVVSIPKLASEADDKNEPKVEASSSYEKKTLADGTVLEMSSSRKTSSSR